MITLEKDGLKMEVGTELQASAFEKNGYVRVTAEPAKEPEQKQEKTEEVPKRRRRRVTPSAE